MWDLEKIYEYVKSSIMESRYIHTLGVIETAKSLARLNGVDETKAEIAALVHDMAKSIPIDEQTKILRNNNIEIDIVTENSPQILHGFVGSILAKELLGIEDEDILNSVKYHTIARKNMSLLEKIIYIADYIEPNRNYPGVQELRQVTFANLNEGVLRGLENTIIYVIKHGQLVHSNTMEARNYLLLDIKSES